MSCSVSFWSPPPAGAPDRFRKIDLQCPGNSSLVVFDELQREEMTCMLDQIMKDSDNSKYCLGFVVCCQARSVRKLTLLQSPLLGPSPRLEVESGDLCGAPHPGGQGLAPLWRHIAQ